MDIQAYQKYIRTSPRKLRVIADMVRNLTLEQALVQLKFAPQRAGGTLHKVINQARANAINSGLSEKDLKIKTILIEEGPTFKRWQPVSRGRAHSIFKRTSHVKVVLQGQPEEKKPAPKTPPEKRPKQAASKKKKTIKPKGKDHGTKS